MTNKEQLAALPAGDWCMRVEWLFRGYGKWFTDSRVAIMKWLDTEYSKIKPVRSNNPDCLTFFCPVCYAPVTRGDDKCCKCISEIDWTGYR